MNFRFEGVQNGKQQFPQEIIWTLLRSIFSGWTASASIILSK